VRCLVDQSVGQSPIGPVREGTVDVVTVDAHAYVRVVTSGDESFEFMPVCETPDEDFVLTFSNPADRDSFERIVGESRIAEAVVVAAEAEVLRDRLAPLIEGRRRLLDVETSDVSATIQFFNRGSRFLGNAHYRCT
jgi:hypothetical protein